jgi:hypothetical protein
VRPGELVSDPETYSFSWPGPERAGELGASLRRFGLLRPLFAVEAGDGLKVVAGARRLRHLSEPDAVPVGVVQASPVEDLWDFLLEDQLQAGSLNPVEIGLYARKRMAATGEDAASLSARVSARLGLPERPGALEDPLWIAGLPDPLKDAFAGGRLPAQGVRVLARAPREDALAVLAVLGRARLGANKFTELARSILECAWREGIPAADWLEREGLTAGAPDPERLRREVRRSRYPTVAAWEDSFQKDAAGARLPGGAHLSHPAGFEGGRLTCSLAFASLGELRSLLAELGLAVEEGRLEPLAKYLP